MAWQTVFSISGSMGAETCATKPMFWSPPWKQAFVEPLLREKLEKLFLPSVKKSTVYRFKKKKKHHCNSRIVLRFFKFAMLSTASDRKRVVAKATTRTGCESRELRATERKTKIVVFFYRKTDRRSRFFFSNFIFRNSTHAQRTPVKNTRRSNII